jgi:lipopolysaccharide heptosyltransferase I
MDDFLLIRLSSLGDIVHALPAFAALRRHRPEARISWVVSPKGREILDLVDGLDEIIVVGTPGWTAKLRRRDRVAVDFQGLLKSAWIGRFSGARRRLGYNRSNLRESLARLFYTESLAPISENDHVILKNLRLLRLLGIEDTRVRFPLTIPLPLKESVEAKLAALGLKPDRRLAVFNVGAAWPTKRWLPERWAEAIRSLDRTRVNPVLLWGSPEERQTAEEIGRKADAPLLPFLSVQEIFGLLKNAALLISGDTFALQAACAVGLPVVAIFGPTSPERNGPFSARDKVAYHELPCSHCYRRACPNPKCLAAVTADDVSALIRESLIQT